jgi:small subunit ribosomal protein S17|tara:strand:- start:127 stop:411 length:285 start_codon:yes stop_codon:yes gene_type:complete
MKKRLTGVVTSDKGDKTLRVEIGRRYRHSMYGKIVRGRTVCHVHDEANVAHSGDVVEIIECRPRSKTKRWDLVRVVESATEEVSSSVPDVVENG